MTLIVMGRRRTIGVYARRLTKKFESLRRVGVDGS